MKRILIDLYVDATLKHRMVQRADIEVCIAITCRIHQRKCASRFLWCIKCVEIKC
jgi:hypothetical protein